MLCSVPWSVVHTSFLCKVDFVNELRVMAGAGWVLIKVGPRVHVGVDGRRGVVGAIAGSGRWAGTGGHVEGEGGAPQVGGGVPAGALGLGARLGGGGVGRRVSSGDVLALRLVAAALERSVCGTEVGEGGINCLVCSDVVLGWLLWWWSDS